MENAKKNDEFQGRIGSLNRDKGYLKKFMKYFGIIILGLFLKTFFIYCHSEYIGDQVFIAICCLVAPFAINELIHVIKNEFIYVTKDHIAENSYREDIKDVNSAMDIMRINLNQISDYYVINKKQASTAFIAAISACVIGFVLICIGVLLIFIRTDSVLSGSIVGVSGVISEIVATLFLVVYNKTIEQINFFYKSLNEKERFLTIIEMAKDLENNREETIVKIIENTLVSYNDEEKLKKE